MTEKKRGRPKYVPTVEGRLAVEQMKFCGESENAIARALGIDVATLRKHFPDELENGHANRRREVIDLLFKSARDGNVSAQKKLEELGRAFDETLNEPKGTAEPKRSTKLGKKEAANLEAQTAHEDSSWGELVH